MKNLALAALAGLALCGAAKADIYSDSAFDTFTSAGGGILDILQVEVTNDLTSINFTIDVLGDVDSTDWGKYMVGIQTGAGGDTGANGNGWGRPISLTGGMNSWIGSWVDSGNAFQTWQYGGGSWTKTGGVGTFSGGPAIPGLVISKAGNQVFITATLASLGITPGQTIVFDVYTSGGGGGDSAIDSLANPGTAASDWGTPYSGGGVEYRVVPTPGVAALGLFGLAAAGRRRR